MKSSILSVIFVLVLTINGIPQEIPNNSKNTRQLIRRENPIVDGNNDFAFRLFHQLLTETEETNIFFSPFSISTAMAMVYAGARTETANQIATTMNFQETKDFHSVFSRQISSILEGSEDSVKLNIANGIWAQKEYPILEQYSDLVKASYNSEFSNSNFLDKNECEKVRKEINSWVESRTNNKIEELIKSGELSELTRLVLINAIYFYGDWISPFTSANTFPHDFFASDKSVIEVKMMHQKNIFNYYEDANLKALELPYAGNKASMIIFLPNEKNGIQKVERLLDYQYYNSVISSFNSCKVGLFLPKIKLSEEVSLKNILAKMGMPIAFSAGADFTGISNDRGLFISDVKHVSFISVDEKGTEAAAATEILFVGAAPDFNIKLFIADHPFILCIKDNATGTILFMGKIVNPN